uniref:Putative reverse transcriptase, RNA-dependent DNA polymerase, Gag-polypeptide of LTR copia-type n=1 Tax=Tanacetum cinerariifolium TaxID=118510 RepID=A0A6L2LQ70_TANCI|nr:putative reverse transcriptase, RNA-dependent DNA polymerase, Gag-polypeptide of LTR copia-type [Tanacetum cinerariifolium]
MFNVIDVSNLNLTVGHLNGTLAKITVVGNLRLTPNVVLFDVLEYCVSLLSIHKSIKDSKLFVGINEHTCYVQDLNLVKTVGTSNDSGGLYLFDVEQCGKYNVGLSNFDFVCHVPKQLWHGRLDHPSDQVLLFLTVRRSDRVRNLLFKFNDFVLPSDKKYGIEKHVSYSNLSTMNFCFATNLYKSTKLKTYLKDFQDQNWVEVMNSELEALFGNNTWILTDLHVNRKTIGCKWLFKIKYKSSDEIERYKARLIAKDYSQRKGIDYEETFSPVVKMVTVRCVISLVMHNSWPLYQLDVHNIFLYGGLNENVYMDLPLGYYDVSETKVCKLVKSLYGLKQSPKQWNEK